MKMTCIFSPHVDYAQTYFKYKTPTKIQGDPSYKSLKTLKRELCANACSIDTDLGGSDHGYLGLVLTDPVYLLVAGVAFVAPAYPPALNIPANATVVEALNLKEQHQAAVNKYRECQNIKKALLRFLQDAIEPKYLEIFIDEDTGLITDDIPTVLDHLDAHYGTVRGDEVKAQEAEVLPTPFTPSDPLVTIWTPIKKLVKLAEQADLPFQKAAN